eukprot:jgi/Tetstr1/462166/TSEL_007231.t1
MTSLVKCAAHVPETRPQVEALVKKHTTSSFLEASAPGAPAAPPAAAGNPLDDLLGLDLGTPAPAHTGAPAAPAGGLNLDDLFGGGASAPVPATAATAAAAPSLFPSVTPFHKDDVQIVLSFSKPQPDSPGVTDIRATISNTGATPVGNFSLQAAVPKFMQLRLDPASGTALQPGGEPVTQTIHVTNTMHGQKPIALRLRISYVHNAATKVEMCEVSGLPPGL